MCLISSVRTNGILRVVHASLIPSPHGGPCVRRTSLGDQGKLFAAVWLRSKRVGNWCTGCPACVRMPAHTPVLFGRWRRPTHPIVRHLAKKTNKIRHLATLSVAKCSNYGLFSPTQLSWAKRLFFMVGKVELSRLDFNM